MSDWLIYSLGFSAQILFSSRLIIQWIQSEKVKKVITPLIFWQLSLLASFLLFVYGWFRDDFAIMLGQVITYFVYIRNLQLNGFWKKLPLFLRGFLIFAPFLILWYSFNNNQIDIERVFKNENIPWWLIVMGSVAQVVFNLRFIYQWIYSEKRKESILPLGFWVLSVTGSSLILIYAILRKDPVLFVGHLFGIVVYIRNIYLIKSSNYE
ncbi:lipid-A-disaccharide synthase N-terminal domain-containing protein [Lutimonas zeaxanthinifaciens]|uniref:lipid-A-disaccharide synthase N-terminal domain-containing protein n=1 Tax=Lutimonas zeaxanthinifaciens TaxID=3060215 RepID=UPI00265D285B|nr:lipid-A-disaccharide synthase N-terminal domain-containing protein [Lutimonas sp. YSD2104]WKK66295.1 lipid-A-disaccharide synthase N-terminal domain-containing protein [Lutimonas sp. YSD2104]